MVVLNSPGPGNCPSAWQLVGLGHDTSDSALREPPAATAVQLVPFQCSMTVSPSAKLSVPPTATQLVVLAHEIPSSVAGGWDGAVIDQREPFHCSMSPPYPTAKQLVLVGHEIAERSASLVTRGSGLASIDHTVPFHRSTSVCLNAPVR